MCHLTLCKRLLCQLTMLLRAMRSLGTSSVMSKVAFKAGSSQHGNARRASVAYNSFKHAHCKAMRGIKVLKGCVYAHVNI